MSLVFGRVATLLVELPSQDLVPKLRQPPFLQIGELAGPHLKLGEHRLFGLSSVHPSGDLGQDFQRELATFGHLLGGCGKTWSRTPGHLSDPKGYQAAC